MERREIDFLRALAYFTESKNIVEVGVQFGDVAVHLASVAQLNGGKYAGFDVWAAHGQAKQFQQMSSKQAVTNRLVKDFNLNQFELIQVDTINNRADFEKELDRMFPGGIDFAFIDGDHSYLGVANDFSVVYPRLNAKGIVAFHDTAVIDGCREFIIDLRTKHYDGTFDIIDFPFGSEERHCGVSILSKKSYATEPIAIDEVCGSIRDAGEIEDLENSFYVVEGSGASTNYKPIKIDEIKMKTSRIGHYPNRKKYD